MKIMFLRNPIGFLSSFLFLAFSVGALSYDYKASVVAFCIFVFVFVISCVYAKLSVKTTKRFVEELNKSFNNVETDEVDGFPLPGLICDPYGEISWYNKAFEEQFLGEDSDFGFRLGEFFPGRHFSDLINEQKVDAEYNGQKYSVFISRLHSSNLPMMSMYFFDDTYLKETEAEYIASRPFVMLVMVDNIEVLSRQLSDSKFALVTSGIESKIENWLNDEKVIIKKISAGRFIVIGEQRTLSCLSEKKFSVLNDVRNYKFNNTVVDATLSIGVGTEGDFYVCEERARKALDMSLGRGGDQAAILNDEGYVYFGGMSNRANDNSKVSPRQTSANMSNLIKKYDDVLIMGHKFSDNDAIGAALGMLYFSHTNGVDARVVVDREKTLAHGLIQLVENGGHELFVDPEEALKSCDGKTLLVVVDTHRPTLVECPELYEKAGARIVIDHHRMTADYISDADIFYHSPTPSSTCEMVTELIEYSANQGKLPGLIATCLLSGIVLDTKDYVLRTSESTFEAAAFLRQNGADTVAVKKLFATDSNEISVKNTIVSNGFIYRDCMISVAVIQDESVRLAAAKAADDMLGIEGVRASFVLSLFNGTVNISARSLGEENVQLVMERLGGGGHSTMAAAQLKNITLDDAVIQLEKVIDEYYESK